MQTTTKRSAESIETDALVTACDGYMRGLADHQRQLSERNQELMARLAEREEVGGACEKCELAKAVARDSVEDPKKWAVISSLMDRINALHVGGSKCGICMSRGRTVFALEAKVRGLEEGLQHQTKLATMQRAFVTLNDLHASNASLLVSLREGNCVCKQPAVYAGAQVQTALDAKYASEKKAEKLARRVQWLEKLVSSMHKASGKPLTEFVPEIEWKPEQVECLCCNKKDEEIARLNRELEMHKSAELFATKFRRV